MIIISSCYLFISIWYLIFIINQHMSSISSYFHFQQFIKELKIKFIILIIWVSISTWIILFSTTSFHFIILFIIIINNISNLYFNYNYLQHQNIILISIEIIKSKIFHLIFNIWLYFNISLYNIHLYLYFYLYFHYFYQFISSFNYF